MKKLRLILIIAVLMGGVCTVSAQQREHHGVSIHLGGILPLQDFSATQAYVVPGTNNFGSNGNAMFGASLGLKYNYVFGFGLGVFASADLIWNALNKDISAQYDAVSCTKPMYVNVPIIAGINYVTDFSDVVDVWAEAGIGADLFFKTQEGWKNAALKYDMNAAFTVEAGAGVTFIDLISIGVHYYWLGKQDVKVQDVNYGQGFLTPHKMNMGAMAFKLGFHF